MMRGRPIAAGLLLAAAAAGPAGGQQTTPDPGSELLHLMPRPAETGKPLIFDRYSIRGAGSGAAAGCAAFMSCRVRLLGVIEKNGAVMLRGQAFSW
jgi:hypothetical protein